MGNYCDDRAGARVSWQFGASTAKHYATDKTPITVRVAGHPLPINGYITPAPGWGTATAYPPYHAQTGVSLSSGSFTIPNFVAPSDPSNYIYWVYGIDHRNVYAIYINGRQIPITPLISDSGASQVIIDPVQIYPGDVVTMATKPNAIIICAIKCGYKLASQYAITITDSLGRTLQDIGMVKPAYNVVCIGCPPGSLDCDGCCADCTDLLAVAEAIYVRL